MLSTAAGGYALPFEVVSMLLLAAMIGCIVIAMKSPAPSNGKAKAQDVGRTEKDSKIKIITTIPEETEVNNKIQKVPSTGGDLGEAL